MTNRKQICTICQLSKKMIYGHKFTFQIGSTNPATLNIEKDKIEIPADYMTLTHISRTFSF